VWGGRREDDFWLYCYFPRISLPVSLLITLPTSSYITVPNHRAVLSPSPSGSYSPRKSLFGFLGFLWGGPLNKVLDTGLRTPGTILLPTPVPIPILHNSFRTKTQGNFIWNSLLRNETSLGLWCERQYASLHQHWSALMCICVCINNFSVQYCPNYLNEKTN
jgi:hypothetical protein